VEDQRRLVETVETKNLTDEDDVIAPLVLVAGATLETGSASIQQRNIARPARHRQSGEFVDATLGKAIGHRLLIGSQHMHCKVLRPGEGRP
jgi:hypothetical protein